MSEQLKFIVQEFSKPPFSKTYNLISFDSLEPIQLLQVLTDVLCEVESKPKIDVREEAADGTAIRLLNSLRLLKYRPTTDVSKFRQGLVQGEKPVIYPILAWLLERLSELQKRAYLARYLYKQEVPTEFMAEDAVQDLYRQYENLVEEFKEVHKNYEHLKNSGYSTNDIKRDIASMEDERDQLLKRIERLKRKVESHPNSGPMLKVASNLRTEKDREQKLQQQKQDQKNAIVHSEQRYQRLQNQLKDIRQASVGATPEGLLHRLEEESQVNTYMVKDKLPKEISLCRKTVNDLQRVVAEPAMGQADLQELQDKIKATNAEVNQLVEKRMMSTDLKDDKLSLFRQQAAIIARKKEAAAEALQEAREEHGHAEAEIDERRQQASHTEGEEVLKGDDFKRYVNKLRSKSTIYKKKRSELAELRAEHGVMSRTEEILKQKDDNINSRLGAVATKKGVSGFRETQEALESVSSLKAELDQMKGRTLEDISFMVQKLTSKIVEKKSALAPIIKELRPMRQQYQELSQEYERKKQAYDTMAAGLESNRSKLETEVRGFREECGAEESRFHYLKAMIRLVMLQQQKVADEMKAYTSSDPADKKRSLREQFSRKIQEQENLGKSLREKQKYVRENHAPNMKQMKMWKDFERLMECKMECSQGGRAGISLGGSMQRSNANSASNVSWQVEPPEEERLVIS